MEKGFNDEELADIMSEIESLEQEFAQDVEEKVQPQDKPHQEQEEVVAQSHEDEEVEEAFEEPQAHEEIEAQQEPEQSQEPQPEVEEVVAMEVQEDKVQPIEEPVEEPKAEVSQEEAHVHASLQEEPVQQVVEEEKDSEMNEVLDELSQMPVEDVTPTHHKQDDNIHHFKGGEKVSQKSNHTAMSFHVEGDMKLELSFHIGDQFIGVHITDEGLVVGLEGGAKFTIPVQPQAEQKKAA